jgi:hypothetical protein
MDFGKLNCNVASPNEQCSPVISCIINDKMNSLVLLEILLKELEENCIIPSILVGLLLILRVFQLLSENKPKIE